MRKIKLTDVKELYGTNDERAGYLYKKIRIMKLLILILILLFLENRFKPRLAWVEESKMLLLFYNFSRKNTRKYIILWK